jgi:hypothetical protein
MNKKSVISLVIAAFIITILAELIGTKRLNIGIGTIVFLPMLYAVVMGILITPGALGKKIEGLRKVIGPEEVDLAGTFVMIALLPLGVKYGTLVGPNIVKVIQAGPALLLQELGNLGTIFLALPVALLLGLKRESVGATFSICRESALGIVGEKYGINSAEGTGVLGTYLIGTLFGTIFFSVLGSLSLSTGLHPYALAMATGMGSGSMMAAASGSLSEAVSPAMKETVLAYAATSNMLTGVTGLYAELFLALPMTNFLYRKLEPILGRRKK